MTRERWAWAVPWFGGGVATSLNDPLVELSGVGIASGVFLGVGIVLGTCWYRLYPRPLAQRLAWLAWLMMLTAALAIVFGIVDQVSGAAETLELGTFEPNGFVGLGVLAGLVITESGGSNSWVHQRRTQLSSRGEQSKLR